MKKQKITFERGEKDYGVGDGGYEVQTTARLEDGTEVATITTTAENVAPWGRERKVVVIQHEVVCYLHGKPTFDAEFDCDGNARSQLAAAKQFVRDHAMQELPVDESDVEDAMRDVLKRLEGIVHRSRTMQHLGGTWGPVATPVRDAYRNAERALEAIAARKSARATVEGTVN